MVAFLAFFACVMAAGLVLKDYAIQASVQEVRAAVQRGQAYDGSTALHTELDGTPLPRWEQQGWRLTGGRTDLLEDNRDALTGFYRHGESTIAYTVIDGSGGVDDGEATRDVTRTTRAGKTALTLGGATGGFAPSETLYDPKTALVRSGLECTDGCISAPLRQVLSVKREVDGHTVVLTGWPLTDGLFTEMQDLALQGDA